MLYVLHLVGDQDCSKGAEWSSVGQRVKAKVRQGVRPKSQKIVCVSPVADMCTFKFVWCQPG